MPSFLIRESSVVGFRPRISAAPFYVGVTFPQNQVQLAVKRTKSRRIFQGRVAELATMRSKQCGWFAGWSVILLFPNQIRRNSHIEAVKEFQIPSPADRDDVLKLQVSTLPGHKRDTELLKVIATREPIGLLDGLLIRDQYGVMDTMKFAVTEIARMISSTPGNSTSINKYLFESMLFICLWTSLLASDVEALRWIENVYA